MTRLFVMPGRAHAERPGVRGPACEAGPRTLTRPCASARTCACGCTCGCGCTRTWASIRGPASASTRTHTPKTPTCGPHHGHRESVRQLVRPSADTGNARTRPLRAPWARRQGHRPDARGRGRPSPCTAGYWTGRLVRARALFPVRDAGRPGQCLGGRRGRCTCRLVERGRDLRPVGNAERPPFLLEEGRGRSVVLDQPDGTRRAACCGARSGRGPARSRLLRTR